MPAGRPTGYDAELGEKLISLMSQGYSLTAAAALTGFHRQRAYEWEKKYPEFADAIRLAKGLRVAKLETDLLAAKDGPNVTSRIFALKNADALEWRDKQELEHSGTMTVQVVKFSENDL